MSAHLSSDSLAIRERYLHRFAHLHRNVHATRGPAPHKPILLLALLQQIDAGHFAANHIPLDHELVASFQSLWQALIPQNAHWQPRMAYPFRHLTHDGFWELVKDARGVTITGESLSLGRLAAQCDGARLAPDLWELLQDPHARAALRQSLIAAFPGRGDTPQPQPQPFDYLEEQKRRLRQQAHARFRLQPTLRERESDGYFVRSRLFPQVIRPLYDFSCCVCRLRARMENASLIEAAHILPFGRFHNDDPRNGLALCRNHHWGFDAGAWSLADDLTILVSPRLLAPGGFVESGQPIASPSDASCRPDPQALAWHRTHVFQRMGEAQGGSAPDGETRGRWEGNNHGEQHPALPV